MQKKNICRKLYFLLPRFLLLGMMTTRFCAPDIHFLSAHCRSNFIEATTVQHHSLSLSLSLSLTHTLTGTHTLSLSLSLSSAHPTRHTHTFKCTRTHIITHTHTHTLTLSHTFSLLNARTNTHFFSFKPLPLSVILPVRSIFVYASWCSDLCTTRTQPVTHKLANLRLLEKNQIRNTSDKCSANILFAHFFS